jgi:chemotaxis protein methyltransferase CheR
MGLEVVCHEIVSATTFRLSQGRGTSAVAEDALHSFIKLIATQTGLHIRQQDRETLRKFMALRMQLLKCSAPEQYYQHIETDTPESHREWQELLRLLTKGESYFFRDQGQFALLRNSILPQLIERRKDRCSLRMWSAGCATGEEPYSLAILVDALLPHRHDWHICILGTDLNSTAIEQAKQAVYSSWSFRMVPTDLQRRYFSKRKTLWELDERMRAMVTFRTRNLLKDAFPNFNSDMHGIDLILCRNVFIRHYSGSQYGSGQLSDQALRRAVSPQAD